MKTLIIWLFLCMIMNCLDLVLTNHFLANTKMSEANPIARTYYESWGVAGLIILKVGSFAIVSISSLTLARKDIVIAQRLVMFGTITVSLIVIYSLYGLFCLYLRI